MSHTFISVTIGVAIALWCAWYCRHLAVEKGRNVLLWTLLGLVLTVVAVPVLVVLPPPAGGESETGDGGSKTGDGGTKIEERETATAVGETKTTDDGIAVAVSAGSEGPPAGDAGAA